MRYSPMLESALQDAERTIDCGADGGIWVWVWRGEWRGEVEDRVDTLDAFVEGPFLYVHRPSSEYWT